MALVAEYRCVRCKKERYEIVLPSRVCSHCREQDHQDALKARRIFLAGLTGLTIEERLSRIEALLYDSDADKRLTTLEGLANPLRY